MRAGLFLRLSVACVAPQTEEVYKRKHVYRTEVFQIQDHFIKEKRHVNQALVGHVCKRGMAKNECACAPVYV